MSVGAFSFGDAKGVAESSAVELQLMEDSQCGTLHLFALLSCGRCGLSTAAWLRCPRGAERRRLSCSVLRRRQPAYSRALAAGSARSFCLFVCLFVRSFGWLSSAVPRRRRPLGRRRAWSGPSHAAPPEAEPPRPSVAAACTCRACLGRLLVYSSFLLGERPAQHLCFKKLPIAHTIGSAAVEQR